MTILHTIVLKIAGVIAAILVLVSGTTQSAPATAPTANTTPDTSSVLVPQTGPVDETTTTTIDIPAPQAQPATAVPVAVPVYIIQTTPASAPALAPLPITPTSMTDQTPAPETVTAQAQGPAIEIISPIGVLRLGRDLEARAGDPLDELNQVLVGGVITMPDGTNVRDAEVTVTTSDPAQKADIKGTGDFTGAPQNVYYYSFTYNVHTVGDHTITFTTGGVSKSVTFTVSKEDDRK